MTNNENFDYLEYEKAATRHFRCCEAICDYLNLSAQNKADKIQLKDAHKNKILWDLYYLSGYIIECAFKYVLLSVLKDNHADEEFETDKNGLCTTHYITEIAKKMRAADKKENISFYENLPWFSGHKSNINFQILGEHWSPMARYKYIKFFNPPPSKQHKHSKLSEHKVSADKFIDYYNAVIKPTFEYLVKNRKIKYRD